ncbi:LysR family transcriptional regulator [Niallia sp. 01092]|uniref:LysR family transcriptional regulator n=1 Tax=unclassified Niallia TaxID=2837522 RepID=UPI003FD0770F
MNMEQLYYIVEIAETGSLKAAAEKQNITLPALSQAVAKLEKEINIELFHRSRNGSYPTEEGQRLINIASEVIMKLQEFRNEAESYTNTLKGEIKIATFPGPMEVLVELITAFKKAYPFIRASIDENNSQTIMDRVYHQEVDIGLLIYTDDDIEKNKQLVFNRLLDGHMIVAVNKKSPLAKESLITKEMLKNQSIILYNDHCITEFIKNCDFLANNMEILFTTNNVETIRNALEKNTAINIGFDYSFETVTGLSNSDKYVTINFAESLDKTYYFGYVYAKNKTLSQISKEFIYRLNKSICGLITNR